MTSISVQDANDQADFITDDFWGIGSLAFDVGPGGTIYVDILDLTADGQRLAKAALAIWTAYTGINFVFGDYTQTTYNSDGSINTVGTPNSIVFDDDQSGAFAGPDALYTGSPTATGADNTIYSSSVNVSVAWLNTYGTTIDSYSFQTYLHEIGHALGLGHAGPYDGSATFANPASGGDNKFLFDSWQMSIMSYFSQTENTTIVADFAYIVSPMMADIIAMQNLYGVAGNLRTGDTTYGIGGDGFDLFGSDVEDLVDSGTAGAPISLTILDDGGVDTFDFSDDTNDQTINLAAGGISSVYGITGNVIIYFSTIIENVIAGSGNDFIEGNQVMNSIHGANGNDEIYGFAGDDYLYGGIGMDQLYGGADDDTFFGGAGNDTIVGGSGTDTVDYSDDTQGVVVGTLQATGAGIGTDSLSQIENVIGGSGNDSIKGGNISNVFEGNDGNDKLYGGGGADWLYGGSHNDTFFGGAGNDRMFGGSGTDTANYSSETGNLVITASSATGAGIGTDSLFGIENIVGGSGNDKITGGNVANNLKGFIGNDRLYGGGGNDKLFGGDDNDTFYGGTGNDKMYGGRGVDTADYSDATNSIVVTTSSATGVDIGTDTLNGIENIVGGSGYDTIRGGNVANRLSGGDGRDKLFGGGGNDILIGDAGNDILNGGAGDDKLYGGTGIDTANYSDATSNLVINTSTATGADIGTDKLYTIENIIGGQGNDVITGGTVNNNLKGFIGDDDIFGGGGNDRMYGGDGEDNLFGGTGNDFLWGGTDSDWFIFETGSGNDTVADFETGTDVIDLQDYGIENYSELTSIMTDTADGVVITLTGSDTILIEGVTISDLSSGDFEYFTA